MSRDITRLTLEMLYKLEDLDEAVLKEDSALREQAPESSRSRIQGKRVELLNMHGCIAALVNSIRIYRGSRQQVKATG